VFDQWLYLHRSVAGGPGYARLDFRISSRTGERAELSVVEQNLLQPPAWEHGDSFSLAATYSLRGVYGRITWRF
jgi:hypothetical protein